MNNKKNLSIAIIVLAIALLASCATERGVKSEVFSEMYSAKPVTVLVMPPINNSTNVDAKDYFYATLAQPVAESGYYVFPPLLSMQVLEQESAYDSEMFLDKDISKFGSTFGADLVLFTIIQKWDKSTLAARVTVEVEYIFRSTKTGDTVYHRVGKVICDTQKNVASGFGLVGSLVNLTATAINTATTDYVFIAEKCNSLVLTNDLPAGKYSPKFGVDGVEAAGAESVVLSTSK